MGKSVTADDFIEFPVCLSWTFRFYLCIVVIVSCWNGCLICPNSFECSFLVSMCINICMCGKRFSIRQSSVFLFYFFSRTGLDTAYSCSGMCSVIVCSTSRLHSSPVVLIWPNTLWQECRWRKMEQAAFITLQNNNLTCGKVLFTQLCHQSCFDYAQ